MSVFVRAGPWLYTGIRTIASTTARRRRGSDHAAGR